MGAGDRKKNQEMISTQTHLVTLWLVDLPIKHGDFS
jgi:hypothetical protein